MRNVVILDNEFLNFDKDNQIGLIDGQVRPLIQMLKTNILFKGSLVNLNEDIWKFKFQNQLEDKEEESVFNFTVIPEGFRDCLKMVIFKKYIFEDLKPRVVENRYFNYNIKFIKFLVDRKIINPALISAALIEDYMQSLKPGLKENTKAAHKTAIRALINALENMNLDLNYKQLYSTISNIDRRIVNLEREQGKTKRIPNIFFEKMLDIAMNEVRDKSKEMEFRIQAAIIILLSQIGLRVGELRILELGRKENIFIEESNISYPILHFKTYKTVRSKEFKWTKTFLTKEAEEVYDFLSEMAKEKGNLKFIFQDKSLYRKQKFRNLIVRFCLRHCNSLKTININEEKLNSMFIRDLWGNYYVPKKILGNLREDDKVFFPLPHQFRVTLATTLYEKGIHLEWIREHMNHLSSDMTEHYIRDEEQKFKHALDLTEHLKESIEDKELDLTHIENRKNILTKIDRFMNKNKINVAVDLDEVVNNVKGRKPIREKELGYCIKSGFGRACPKNSRIDIPDLDETRIPSCEFLHITFNRFKTIQEIIRYNKKNGFKVEAQRESKRLIKLINTYLIPELKELKQEMKRLGEDVLKEYEHLEIILKNIKGIEGEVEKCLRKIQ